jgi:SPP1 family predicted phage head-tail adaptor
MAFLNTGALRERLVVQTETETQDTTGEPIRSWQASSIGTRWGRIRPLRGRELFQAGQVDARITHEITMRYAQGITPKMRIAYTDPRTAVVRIFDIESIATIDERRHTMTLYAVEQV